VKEETTKNDPPKFTKSLVSDSTGRLVANSVQLNGTSLNNEIILGTNELDEYMTILDNIIAHGCVYCWIKGDVHTQDTNHKRDSHWSFATELGRLTKEKKNVNALWPFCFRCMVPYHPPGGHLRPIKDTPISEDDCGKYQLPDINPNIDEGDRYPIVPVLLVLIQGAQVKNAETSEFTPKYATAIAKVLDEQGTTFESFAKWLFGSPTSITEIPNPVRYMLTFVKLFHRNL
jgi:hypothetical protein